MANLFHFTGAYFKQLGWVQGTTEAYE